MVPTDRFPSLWGEFGSPRALESTCLVGLGGRRFAEMAAWPPEISPTTGRTQDHTCSTTWRTECTKLPVPDGFGPVFETLLCRAQRKCEQCTTVSLQSRYVKLTNEPDVCVCNSNMRARLKPQIKLPRPKTWGSGQGSRSRFSRAMLVQLGTRPWTLRGQSAGLELKLITSRFLVCGRGGVERET